MPFPWACNDVSNEVLAGMPALGICSIDVLSGAPGNGLSDLQSYLLGQGSTKCLDTCASTLVFAHITSILATEACWLSHSAFGRQVADSFPFVMSDCV